MTEENSGGVPPTDAPPPSPVATEEVREVKFKEPEQKEGFRRIRYGGRGGASVDTLFGTFNIHAPDWHPEFSPVKDVREKDAVDLIDTSLFAYEE